MKEYQDRYGVTKTAEMLGASRSGYYAWKLRKPGRHEAEDLEPAKMTGLIFKEHYSRYENPRVWKGLKPKGVRVSRKQAGRLM
jgi:hypothetical protein